MWHFLLIIIKWTIIVWRHLNFSQICAWFEDFPSVHYERRRRPFFIILDKFRSDSWPQHWRTVALPAFQMSSTETKKEIWWKLLVNGKVLFWNFRVRFRNCINERYSMHFSILSDKLLLFPYAQMGSFSGDCWTQILLLFLIQSQKLCHQ